MVAEGDHSLHSGLDHCSTGKARVVAQTLNLLKSTPFGINSVADGNIACLRASSETTQDRGTFSKPGASLSDIAFLRARHGGA